MKKIILALLSIVAITSCKNDKASDLSDGLYAVIETNKGDIIASLDYKNTPITVANFVSLAEGNNPLVEEQYKNKPFYDGLKFHRVVEDFVIQAGDPRGTGSGGPGYAFDNENNPALKHDKAGILAMANAGLNTNGSQFYITLSPQPTLDGGYTVFGEVVKGLEILPQIKRDDIIKTVKIIRKGKEADLFNASNYFKEAMNKQQKDKDSQNADLQRVVAENQKKLTEAKAKAIYTKNGIGIYILEKGTNEKPKAGDQIKIDYAGFFEDGRLFDTGIEEIAIKFNALDQQRKAYGQYQPIPFTFGDKEGLIPGFIEGFENMNYGDRALIFIPSKFAYGERGAGEVIPPNTNLVFELILTK